MKQKRPSQLYFETASFFITNQFLCSMKNRIAELDYLKSIFILLMIVFHLVYIGDKYPYAKSFGLYFPHACFF